MDQSDWAAPIVVVKKKDGGIRICADFKTTIHPHLRMKTFPLPTPDEVFSTLANGESFSKLDLARTYKAKYKQMEVEENSRPYLTIRTWGCSAITGCLLELPLHLQSGRRQCQSYCKDAKKLYVTSMTSL